MSCALQKASFFLLLFCTIELSLEFQSDDVVVDGVVYVGFQTYQPSSGDYILSSFSSLLFFFSPFTINDNIFNRDFFVANV